MVGVDRAKSERESAERVAPKPDVTQQEVDAIRQRVRGLLTEANESAEQSGKPLLILVGEHHGSPHSALIEAIIYQEARAIGVRDVALEFPSRPQARHTRDAKHSLESFERFPSRLSPSGSGLTHAGAAYYNDTLHFVDGRADLAINGLNLDCEGPNCARPDELPVLLETLGGRNETIAANLALIPRPTMMVTGLAHLSGLTDLMGRHATHEVINFNVSPSGSFDGNGLPSSVLPPRSTHTLTLIGNASKLTIDRLITLGMGTEEGSAFIRWAEERDYKPSRDELKAQVPELRQALEDNPQNTAARAKLMSSLLELGRDTELAEAIQRFVPPSHFLRDSIRLTHQSVTENQQQAVAQTLTSSVRTITGQPAPLPQQIRLGPDLTVSVTLDTGAGKPLFGLPTSLFDSPLSLPNVSGGENVPLSDNPIGNTIPGFGSSAPSLFQGR